VRGAKIRTFLRVSSISARAAGRMERTTTTTTSTAHRNAETTARENADDLCRFLGLDCAGGQGRSVPPKVEGPTQEINPGSPAVCHDGLRPERNDHLPLRRPASRTSSRVH